ncbi:MAG: response regulator (CheY-like receiver and HD-GYP domain containing protein) [Solidesulfovibrio magneticus str. Maddingley MBC34]|uniref:Response regulator (CheY-like receiver and HD-GYP domain containing protein) n=1 Tax=Solidesulfovibrio magneticus str. Maddingley MBC34 TaxID=1206767 RepID=K6GVP9_9BACT|nr:MAG: response regulator (CheY-like receiver and HD-GYP domain containing protein) [Solidesulfovibrio magneticus str. Maddingley MBC34]
MKTLAECLILLVDDTETNLDILVDTLGEDYEVAVATDGPSALALAREQTPDLILLDIMMPGMDGYEVCRRLMADPVTAQTPVIFLTALTDVADKTRGFAVGGVDYVTKPFEPAEIQARTRTHLSLRLARQELARQNEILEEKVRERTRELALTQDAIIEAMAGLAEYRDPETGAHIKRTRNYVRVLAEKLRAEPRYAGQFTDETIDLLYKSAPLHDIGKVGVRDDILLKPGPLTDVEFAVMRHHTVYGRDAIQAAAKNLGDNSFLRLAQEIAYTHQERWDGSGYPQGLAGEAIPIPGRLMAIADVYDALISRRVYKAPFTHAQAVTIIRDGRGSHFDPAMVDAFLDVQETFRQIALKFTESDEERQALEHPYVA